MERRELLKMIAAATGCAFVGGEVWASGVTAAAAPASAPEGTIHNTIFSATDIALLDEIAETILPTTTTPGAKDAACGTQMAVQIRDCYNTTEQAWFMDGLTQLEQRCQQDYQHNFMQLSQVQRHQLLVRLDGEAKLKNAQLPAANDNTTQSANSTPHYFTLLKQLTLFVFFTSKVAATQVLRYSAIPGKYDGNLPYKKGDRAWAT